MECPIALKDYIKPKMEGSNPAIDYLGITATKFKIDLIFIQIVMNFPFHGMSNEDPHAHIWNFFCETFQINGVSEDAKMLQLFLFPLMDKARLWLNSLLTNSSSTWDKMQEVFLNKYLPPIKTIQICYNVYNFVQEPTKSFHDDWE